jgi:hypothetical protein
MSYPPKGLYVDAEAIGHLQLLALHAEESLRNGMQSAKNFEKRVNKCVKL